MTNRRIADLDRLATRIDRDQPGRGPLSGFRGLDRVVLLGEPGIGKTTAFEREAAAAGTRIASASAFVRGARPPGSIAFIDGLEEYRIGEAGIDRLENLITAISNSPYTGWRIACRAISMGPADAARIAATLGGFATLQLEPLQPREQRQVMTAIGVSDPAAFSSRVEALGAEALMANPTTLILLTKTIGSSSRPITSRSELLAEATRQMSHELNPLMPERSSRPSPATVEAAAEAACLVLTLSARTDLFLHSSIPPHDGVVTRDDLVPGRVDTEALRSAVDTPMFKSDGVVFQPSHRIIAEYLAGRALARAVVPPDPSKPALPIGRAIGLCCGDDDRPAPALTGVFAWFVTGLARSRRPELAAQFLELDPEAVLFHGDAAALTTDQRARLLHLVGRGDPWLLGAARGSTAIGGLAGDDLAEPMRRIITDDAETRHRRMMVLEALANGPPVAALAGTLRALVTTPSSDEDLRDRALGAYLRIVGDTPATRGELLAAIGSEPAATAAALRVELVTGLISAGVADADKVRDIIVGYADTGDRAIGHAHNLSRALEEHPVTGLFDAPLPFEHERGVARSFEIRRVLDHALAQAIATQDDLSGERLLRWIEHAGIDEDRTNGNVMAAIGDWLDRAPGHEAQLLDALEAAVARQEGRFWRADLDFRNLSGRAVSSALREPAIAAVESAVGAPSEPAVDRAIRLIQPYEEHPALYWRLHAALEMNRQASAFARLTVEEVPPWRTKRAQGGKNARTEKDQRHQRDRN